MEKVNQLLSLVEEVKVESDKFYNKSNQSAGLRLRKVAQEIKKVAQAIRVDVSEIKKANKEKKEAK